MLFFVLVVILLFKMVPWRSAEAGECLRVPQAVTRLVEKMCVRRTSSRRELQCRRREVSVNESTVCIK